METICSLFLSLKALRWEEVVLSGSSLVFLWAAILMLKDEAKPPMITAVLNSGALYACTVAGWWLDIKTTAVIYAAIGLVWSILGWQRWKMIPCCSYCGEKLFTQEKSAVTGSETCDMCKSEYD